MANVSLVEAGVPNRGTTESGSSRRGHGRRIAIGMGVAIPSAAQIVPRLAQTQVQIGAAMWANLLKAFKNAFRSHQPRRRSRGDSIPAEMYLSVRPCL